VSTAPRGNAIAARLTLAEVAKAVGGSLEGGIPETRIAGVSTDSRSLCAQELFVALIGERFDGHQFVPEAMAKGAAAALVCRSVSLSGPLIRVADTLLAYGDLARCVRDRSNARVIAVTGSTGKTTTREMLATILRQDRRTLSSVGTENNEVGVPRTILKLTEEHEALVLEFAMRGPGEIARLAQIGRPDVGVVTNVGVSHIGRLHSKEAIAAAKAELIEALEPMGRAVLNADDSYVAQMASRAKCPTITYGFGDADVRASDVETGSESVRFRVMLPDKVIRVTVPVPGRHNVYNALAAAAAAYAVGASPETICMGLGMYEGMPMRARIVRGQNGVVVLDDTYNASPDSVRAALETLRDMRCTGRRIAVLGPMLELGEFASQEHREIGRTVAQTNVDVLITVGELAEEIAAGASGEGVVGLAIHRVSSNDEALELLRGLLLEGDAVLVKGSRAAGMEKIVKGLVG